MNKRALGRGLSTLLPPRQQTSPQAATIAPPQASEARPGPGTELPLHRIVPNPFQPRKHFDEAAMDELAQSIRVDGVIQPLVVRKAGDTYELIAGERRLRAAKIAGLSTVPVRVQDIPDERMLEVALVENIQREDLDPIEAARAFERLSTDLGLSQEEIGQRTGKDRATISNFIRLLQLPENIQNMVVEKKLSAGHARALLKLNDGAAINEFAQKAYMHGWSVRRLEQATSAFQPVTAERSAPRPNPADDPNIKAAMGELENRLGTKVSIYFLKPGRGRLEIDFYSPDDLQRIYAVIAGE